MKYFIGIDCSISSHSVCIVNEKKEKIKDFQISNDLNGFINLKENLVLYPDHIIGFELSHGPLIDYLRNENENKLYSVNPLKIKRFKETYIVSTDKTDSIDARAIALYVLMNESRLRPMMFNSPEIEQLKVYRITYDRLRIDHARYLNRLRYIFRQYFPLYDYLFSTFGCKVMLQMVLSFPVWTDLSALSDDEIKDFLILNNYRVGKNIDRVLKKIHEYDQIVNDTEELPLSLEAQTIIKILLIIKDELEIIRKRFKNILNNHKLGDIFLSLPGAGIVLASQMLTIWGDNKERFTKANQIQSLIGTAPCNYSSGKMNIVKIRKACNKHARATLYIFAFTSLRYSQWAREYYNRQREMGKTNSVSIRALSNVWVRKIFSMWKNNSIYNENKVIIEIEKFKKIQVA